MTRGPLRVRVAGAAGALSLAAAFEVGNETLVVIGPNGSGKTSLFLLILGVLPVRAGRVSAGDRVLFDSDASVTIPLEGRAIGYVPQDFALFPHLDVRENVAFAVASAAPELSASARAERVAAALADLGLEALAERDTRRLSGGERQRLALARALATEPRALLLDEPLAALDIASRRAVRSFLRSYLVELALPSLIVTHDPNDARTLADRILVLEHGRVTQLGTWAELTRSPGSRFVAEFVAAAAPPDVRRDSGADPSGPTHRRRS